MISSILVLLLVVKCQNKCLCMPAITFHKLISAHTSEFSLNLFLTWWVLGGKSMLLTEDCCICNCSLTYAEIFMSLLKMPCVNQERNTAVILSVLKPLETILNQPLYVNNPLWGLWNVNLKILIWVFTSKIFTVIAGGAALHLHMCRGTFMTITFSFSFFN